MKCAVAFSILLAGSCMLLADPSKPAPSLPERSSLLDDLVQMTRSGSSDAAILAYARAHRAELPPEISNGDLGRLRDAGVSERVVAYMSAIDVRDTGEEIQANADSTFENEVRPRGAYPETEGEDESYGGNEDGYAGGDAGAYPDNSYDAYSGYGCPDCGDYPFFGYGDFAGPFYFSDGRAFFPRFHRRDERFRRHREFDRGRRVIRPRGDVRRRLASREAWRDRDPRGRGDEFLRRGASRDAWRESRFRDGRAAVAVRPRAPAGPGFTRGPGPRPRGAFGSGMPHRGFGPRGAPPAGFGGAQRGFAGPGGFGRPGSSGGGRRSGGGSSGGRGRR